VLVIVVTIGGVPMAVVHVVDVLVVRHRIVTAAWTVGVLMTGVGQVRQRVLVVVLIVGCVRVSFVHVVDMVLALHARVPAAGAVLVAVVRVNDVIAGCHWSSLLC
jgi:hypothetical protein